MLAAARRASLVAVIVLGATTMAARSQEPPTRLARAVEPIGALLDAFRTHAVVALSEDHGNEQGHAFRLALLRDARFAETVDDIVVEFGNARYQEIVDRFVAAAKRPATAVCAQVSEPSGRARRWMYRAAAGMRVAFLSPADAASRPRR